MRNLTTFAAGTFGRDMVYTLISMYLIFYLTDVLALPAATMVWIGGIILFARIFDAVTDPVMGAIVDNTRTRFGKFKPWLMVGVLTSPIFTVLLFWDYGAGANTAYIVRFGIIYILWGIAYTTHDISYWSMLPTLSMDQKRREKIGAAARICANLGLFTVAAGIVPITAFLADAFDLEHGYTVFAVIVSAIMALGLCITVFGVREPHHVKQKPQSTGPRELLRVIYKNDQLLCVAFAMSLFMIGYITTVTFGLYFFEYDYGNQDMYPIFALILGVSQICALMIFPILSKRIKRMRLYSIAMILVTTGYVVFFFAPTYTLFFVGIAGVLLFVGQGFIQLLMLMFLSDSVDYGHFKLGRRNDSISFSVQPFINKMGGAVGSAVVVYVLIFTGIQDAPSAEYVTSGALVAMRVAMLIFPLVLISASYFIVRSKYRIDEAFHAEILSELRGRGEIE